MKKLVIASNNPGKLAEFQTLLAPLGIEVVTQAQLGIKEAEEPHHTFIENALAKARHVSRESGLPALADDSGICVDALNGMPGVVSARFSGLPSSDERNNKALLEAMKTHTNRNAHYYCVLVLLQKAATHSPSSRKANGTAKSPANRAAQAASATTRCSGCQSLAR